MIAFLQTAPEGEPPYFALGAFLVITSILIAASLWTAFRGQRRLHVRVALATVTAFAIAIYFAEKVGTYWVFDDTYKTIHFAFAYPATGLALVAVVTGSLHYFKRVPLVLHRWIALLFVFLVPFAIATAFLMFQHGERL